jgi:hypothetical protein
VAVNKLIQIDDLLADRWHLFEVFAVTAAAYEDGPEQIDVPKCIPPAESGTITGYSREERLDIRGAGRGERRCPYGQRPSTTVISRRI